MEPELAIANRHMESWYNQLKSACRLSDVVSICMEISAKSGRIFRHFNPVLHDGKRTDSSGLVKNVDQQVLDSVHRQLFNSLCDLVGIEDVPHAHRKQIAKACFSLCRNLSDYDELIWPRIAAQCGNPTYEISLHEMKSIVMYGMVNSPYLKHLSDPTFVHHLDQLNVLFQSPGSGYNRWFYTIAECMLSTLELLENLPGSKKLPHSPVWLVTLVNLESPYRSVRDLMLRLLKYLIRSDQFVFAMFQRPLERWHWQNRNKYHLLALLLREHAPGQVLEKCSITDDELENALIQSLRYKHLISGGQAMLRALPSEKVHRLAVRVFRTGDIGLVRNMVKYWFTTLSPNCRSAIFELLELNELTLDEHSIPAYLVEEKYDRLFLVMNLFEREFNKNCETTETLLLSLCQLANSVKPLPATSMGLLIKTLTHHICSWRWEPAGKFLLLDNLLQLLLEAIETPSNIGLCNIVVEQCRLLLEKSNSSNDEQWHVVPRLLYAMYEHHLCPNESRQSGPYHQTITALRMFALLVQQCFEFPPNNHYQLTLRAGASMPWSALRSSAYINQTEQLKGFHDDVLNLSHLLHSEYDDVCIAAASLLYNQLHPYFVDASLLASLTNIKSCTPHLYPIFLASTERDVVVAIEHVHRDLFENATLIESSDRPCIQLHQAVERASQVCFGIPELLATLNPAEPFLAVARAVGSVVETVLNLLNAARPTAASDSFTATTSATGTSFEIMECSMQQLLDGSSEWARVLKSRESPVTSVEITLAKRAMQAELWKALRAVAIFTEQYVYWLLEHSVQSEDLVQRELGNCMAQFGSILLNCCHRGAIESSASCLVRVVRQIMHNKVQRNRVMEHAADNYRTADALVGKLFRETLSGEPAQSYDFRRARGYLFLLHSIMQGEADGGLVHGSLLHYYLQRRVMLGERARQNPMHAVSLRPIAVLELHQLNLLVKAASLNEVMVPYIDELMVVTLNAFRSPDWAVRNAALQLYTSCTVKLAGQRQHYFDTNCDWPPVYVSLDEMVFQLPLTGRYIEQELHAATIRQADGEHRCPTSFLLLLLEFLTRFEYRAYGVDGHHATVATLRSCVWKLLSHGRDQVRHQAARCYVQLHDLNLLDSSQAEFLATTEHLLNAVFSSCPCPNRQHGLMLCVYFYVRRYVTLRHFAQETRAREDTFARVRRMVVQSTPHGTDYPSSYRCRSTLLDFLTYIGFDPTDPLLSHLLIRAQAPNEHGRETFHMACNRAAHSSDWHSANSATMPYEVELDLYHEPEQDE